VKQSNKEYKGSEDKVKVEIADAPTPQPVADELRRRGWNEMEVMEASRRNPAVTTFPATVEKVKVEPVRTPEVVEAAGELDNPDNSLPQNFPGLALLTEAGLRTPRQVALVVEMDAETLSQIKQALKESRKARRLLEAAQK
jgi:hypothetical protein